MLKLIKYLKPFLLIVLFAMILLFLQAYCDLQIPKITADIVNVGIQQSGIENATPIEISENGLKLMKIFMSDEERLVVDQAYTFKTDQEINKYVLKDEKPENQEELNTIFSDASNTLLNVAKTMMNTEGGRRKSEVRSWRWSGWRSRRITSASRVFN